MQIFVTYILDELNPFPQVTHKTRPQLVDTVQGNDFIAENIGANAKLKHKIFHHFFAMQDPITTPPPKKKCHSYKMNKQHQCKESQNTKPVVADTKGLEMAHKQTEQLSGKRADTACGMVKVAVLQ
eukprot:6648376-Ditylum_brightwellii.AAC.1